MKLRKKSGYGSLSPCEGATGRVEQDAAERVCQVNQSGMRIIRQLPDIKPFSHVEPPHYHLVPVSSVRIPTSSMPPSPR